jgi:hypothetical protein
MEGWVAWMGAHGIDAPAARQYLVDWSKEDTYLPLADELAALARSGFGRPECFYRRGPTTIYGGSKG